jgi:transglutaminase-like putative cysteine protease
MSIERQFSLVSYFAVVCGFVSLWVSSSFGILETLLFAGAVVLAWKLEGSRWQITERVGTALVVLSIPFYYIVWRFFIPFNTETALPGILARLILTLTGIKLLQKKSDRDWMFLFLMAFFEVLLAAGLSISIGYFVSFVLFVFVMASAIILFQIRKASRTATVRSASDENNEISLPNTELPMRRVFAIAGLLLLFTSIAAIPVFFLLPRVTAAGFGGSESVKAFAGFSDSVKLGGIGTIQLNDAIVMRVRIENEAPQNIHWRGIALDTFDGQYWSRSKTAIHEPKSRNDRDLIQVDSVQSQERLTLQTVYLEPLDTPVIFGLYRMIGIQGNFQVLYRDAAGAITYQRTGERVNYKVLSDADTPDPQILREDRSPYSPDVANNLQLPKNLDPRVEQLAQSITADAQNRYDAASRVESYLQNSFGYTLEQKAGGSDPLADFLFNVREGHCEYFATSMAIMLRTQGIASRVVNGFQRGEYNETADVYVVRQRNAHSWVEVYFPGSDSWVAFDPTPAAGQNLVPAAGISEQVRKYMEALEAFWIQYFVAFDNQEQRSLFVSVRNGFTSYQSRLSAGWDNFQTEIADWWKRVRGDEGLQASLSSIGFAVLSLTGAAAAIFVCVWFFRRLAGSGFWQALISRTFNRKYGTSVEFYERMQKALAAKGIERSVYQTPLEFAHTQSDTNILFVTERYNLVRFGQTKLSSEDSEQIESWLEDLENRRA